MKTETNETARRKFKKACKLLSEVCAHLGKDSITIRVHHTAQEPTASIILAPSHIPTRHPERPLPRPTTGQRSRDGEFLRDALGLELERRQVAAKRWSDETNHLLPLDAVWKPVHHKECCSEKMGASSCDCGPIFLTRFADQTFAVGHDGQLEPFTASQRPVNFIADMTAYFVDQSFTVSEWMQPLLAETLEFSTYGSGGHEHFLELPHESDIETRSVQ
jgi:hypothetical protein